jgi:hypothetical protein
MGAIDNAYRLCCTEITRHKKRQIAALDVAFSEAALLKVN